MSEWGGKLIEVPYSKGISSTKLNQLLQEIGTTPDIRRNKLRRLLEAKPLLRFLEAHNGLTGLIVENANVIDKNGMIQDVMREINVASHGQEILNSLKKIKL